jgi:hypothetical protein
MINRRALSLLAQLLIPLIASVYAVREGTPYLALRRSPWWQTALRWPQVMMFQHLGTAHPLAVPCILFLLYFLIAFWLIHYLIEKLPFRKQRPEAP